MRAAFVGTVPSHFERVYGKKQREKLKELADIDFTVHETVTDGLLSDAEVIFSTWGMPAVTEEEIRRFLPKLKAVYYAAGTVQGFARPFLNCGVRVFSAWQANAVPVAEYAFAQILLSLKGYFQVQRLTRTNRREGQELFEGYPGVFEVKVGLLGCGAVGSRVAELLKNSDAEVLVFDPFLSDERAEELHVRKADMAEIFSTCMVVSNHLANLPETVGIIRREYFLSMPPYSTFINTGRGPQLDEKDLCDMLTMDPTRTALLDVMTEERFSDSNPLNALPNCFITPHIAGSSGREVMRMADYMICAYRDMMNGKTSPYEVSLSMLSTMA